MRLGEAARLAAGENWLMPRYEDYVVNKENDPGWLEKERDALVQIMTRAERIRTKTFSASGAGRCGRERQFAYLGKPRRRLEPKGANIFANGDYMHLRHQVAGLVSGYLTEAEHFVTNDEWGLTGTIDAITTTGAIAEFKSINARGYQSITTWGPKREHEEQIHSYMLLSGLDTAWLLYENKDTQQMKEFRVERDEFLMDKVKRELDDLRRANEQEELLPMLPECVDHQGAWRWCDYRDICPLARFASGADRKRKVVIQRA